MLTFRQYITEIFDTKLKAPKPIIRKEGDGTTHRYNLPGKLTGGPRGVVQVIRQAGKPSAYVSFDFNSSESARRKKVLPTKVAVQALGHVLAAVKHHVDTHGDKTTQITYDADSPRRDRMYKMIGKRLNIPMKNLMPEYAKGASGMNRDILERGSRIGKVSDKKEYFKRVVSNLKARGKRSKVHRAAASNLKVYVDNPDRA